MSLGFIIQTQKSISSVASVWKHKLFEPEGPACFMPVQRIKGKCICSKVTINNEELLTLYHTYGSCSGNLEVAKTMRLRVRRSQKPLLV